MTTSARAEQAHRRKGVLGQTTHVRVSPQKYEKNNNESQLMLKMPASLLYRVAHAAGRVLPLGQKLSRSCAAFCSMDGGMAGGEKPPHQFEVLGRDLAYSGWRKIVKKTVRIENNREYVFDVVHQVSST